MKISKLFLTSVLLMFVCCATMFAQTIKVNGSVVDAADEQPLIGASVIVRGTTIGVISDTDGKFSIEAKDGDMLEISCIGYKTVVVAAAPLLNVLLVPDQEFLDEVVVTGYMTEKKADLTGSVSVVSMKDIVDVPTGNVLSSLQGRVPGLNITTDGTPGGGNTSALVRGTTTFNSSGPLYVVDGIMTRENLNTILQSSDIESIQVLKDAASAAIYGAQAAGGVIIITTKQPKEGQIKVDFEASLSAQTYATGIPLLNAQEWGDVYWAAYKYDYGTTPKDDIIYGSGEKAVPQEYYYDADGIKIRVGDTDWQKETYKTALMQKYNLNLSKGSRNHVGALNVSYLDQDGLIRNTDYQSFSTRLMNEFRFLNNRLIIGENFSVSRRTQHLKPSGIEEHVLAQHPAIPIYDDNGGYAGGYVGKLGDKPNIIRLTDNIANDKSENWRLFGNAYISVTPVKNLTIKSTFGLNYSSGYSSTFVPKWREGSRKNEENSLSVSHSNSFNWVWTNTANYNLDLGKHSASFLIGHEMKKNTSNSFSGSGTDLGLENLDYRYLSVAEGTKTVTNSASYYAMISYFAKVNYNYDDRYLASVTVRRDASSRFGAKNNYGIFPSFSLGWRISQERFMENTKSWLSDLKLRASYGINGNDQIAANATYNLYSISIDNGSYNLSGDNKTLDAGTRRTRLGNEYLKWEETTQFNVGVDAAFFGNRLTFSADYFNKDTDGMLYAPSVAAVVGEGSTQYQNCAGMNNKGFETVISWRNTHGDFSYEIAFNLSHYANKITYLPEEIYYTFGCGNGTDITNVGLPYGSWLGYVADGLFRTQAEVDEYKSTYNVKFGQPGVGRIRWADVNGDKEITTADRKVLGSDNPKFIGGLNFSARWKGLDISLFFNGMIRDAYNNSKYYTDLFQNWTGNHSTRLLEALSAYERFEETGYYDSDIPALTTSTRNREGNVTSSWQVEDGSYIKLKNLTVGYTLPENVRNTLKLRNARVFVQAQNLFCLTKYTGADPEGLGYVYPMPRTFTLGLTFGF
ncbi:MAG: TonB-dependent receptor [Bacteroidales bacterium]|nr:TonB-dependent receptor [Bacteroidales bacterium]